MPRFAALTALLLVSVAPLAAHAENSKPQPIPYEHTIPQPRDIAYPGTMKLEIDATDTKRAIFNVKETLPVAAAGHMVLQFPQWLPGAHSPRGELDKLAGLHIYAAGKEVPWTRDPVDVYSFHIDVPAGTSALDIRLQFISATASNQGPVVMSPTMMRLQWNSMSLVPAGYFTRQIPVSAVVTYPQGWTAASGLPSTANGSTYTYQATNYEVLVDSPVLAGKYYKQWQLSPRVFLDTFADSPAQLEAKPEQIEAHKRLVEQAVKTFGNAQHYDNYHFLFSIGESIGGIGLEHHRSSEDGTDNGYFTEWDDNVSDRNLLPHEYTHSWDGKFRRGADLWTPTYNVPMRDSLLWVYEGQTQFWGYVLQARANLVSKADTLDEYAMIMAQLDNRPARQWRDLLDTTNDPVMSQRRPKGWVSWQRSEDYYNEGLLVWMEVDSVLRRESKGKKSIDDFAKAFFGINDGDWGEVTYNFDDVVKTLNQIQPYDWAGLLTKRLTETGAPAPLQGFVNNGYKLVYTDKPSSVWRQGERNGGPALPYSLGFNLNKTGAVSSVIWDSPAFKAGLTTGDTILAVNGTAYDGGKLKEAVTAAKTGTDPIRLTIKSGERVYDVAIDYHGGLRYPHLEKIGKGDSGLDLLLTPR